MQNPRQFKQRTTLAVACAAIMAGMSVAVVAQNSTDTSEIREIRVTAYSRRPELLSGINGSIAILGEEDLKLTAHTHIQEAANRLPGVNINRNNGQESLTAIRSPVLSGGGACGAFLMAE